MDQQSVTQRRYYACVLPCDYFPSCIRARICRNMSRGKNKNVSDASQALLLCYGCYGDVIRPRQTNMMQRFPQLFFFFSALKVSASSQGYRWRNSSVYVCRIGTEDNMALAGHGSFLWTAVTTKKHATGKKGWRYTQP